MIAYALALSFASNTHLPKVEGVDGRPHDLRAEARGRPIALVFVSHDCPVCNSYAPELGRIIAQYRGRVLLGIVYAEPDITPSVAEHHAKAYGLTRAELLLDPKGKLSSACGARMTPEAAVLGVPRTPLYLGRIDDLYYDLGKQRPAAKRHDLRLAIDAVLANKIATPAPGPPFGCVIETAAKP